MTKIRNRFDIRKYDLGFVSNFVFRASDFMLSEQVHLDKTAVYPEAGN